MLAQTYLWCDEFQLWVTETKHSPVIYVILYFSPNPRLASISTGIVATRPVFERTDSVGHSWRGAPLTCRRGEHWRRSPWYAAPSSVPGPLMSASATVLIQDLPNCLVRPKRSPPRSGMTRIRGRLCFYSTMGPVCICVCAMLQHACTYRLGYCSTLYCDC